MDPIVDHIEITVKDMSVAVPFYDKLLPLLGFDVQERVSAVMQEHDKHVVQYSHPRLGFAITSPAPNQSVSFIPDQPRRPNDAVSPVAGSPSPVPWSGSRQV